MSRVILTFSMSLDGYVAGPDIGEAFPMGRGGEKLHGWMFPADGGAIEPADRQAIDEQFATAGAVVVGRRTYDIGWPHWGDTPYPAPTFVLTHRAEPERQMKSASFRFVTDGVESAVRQARDMAIDRDVIVMGAETAQQVLGAGLADALHIQLVPLLLGSGARLFDNFGRDQLELVRTDCVPTARTTHLKFNIIRKGDPA